LTAAGAGAYPRAHHIGDGELEEGTVGGTGYRRLLRFDTVIINAGDGDLLVGDPADPSGPYHDNFFFAECHQHYHNEGFADYLQTAQRPVDRHHGGTRR
jgi:hypothetical protein